MYDKIGICKEKDENQGRVYEYFMRWFHAAVLSENV
jgi:hypothetical protein